MEDDKRFIRSDDKEPNSEEKKKIPFEFNDIKLPFQKPAQPEEEPKAKPENVIKEPKTEPEKQVEQPKTEPERKIEPPKIEPAAIQEGLKISPRPFAYNGPPPPSPSKPIAKMPNIFIIYILSAFLCISFLVNLFLAFNISSLRKRIESDAKVVENIVTGKKTTQEEKESYKEEAEGLKRELSIVKTREDNLKKQADSIKDEFTRSKQAYTELEDSIGEYAEEVKQLATRRIKYFDAYKAEKENVAKLNLVIQELQSETEIIRSQIGSMSDKYKDKEAKHIYTLGVLYTKAGMFDDALKNFEEYLDLKGEDADTHFNIGYIYEYAKKDRDKAISHYKKYLRLNPDAEDLYEVRMKISSLERAGEQKSGISKPFKVNLDKIKF